MGTPAPSEKGKEMEQEEKPISEFSSAAWTGDTDKVAKMLERDDHAKFLNNLNSHGKIPSIPSGTHSLRTNAVILCGVSRTRSSDCVITQCSGHTDRFL